ncbi:hypothetical protein ACIRA0001_0411 [Acinetobacter radioresistens SK82]|uniref:Uncharacterized protein n=1 Tax=Acinetobacter radioresistens SK82 TaxID=596318 RepID=A0ABM9YRQ5_ACIRA|nr:hypothetical protein ACIRA0001_0411 [Acinetobacter radioresistens SK82]EJO33858.1 hypothetical protein ACINWCA157_A0011 [Acinetobacter radioresistens WC-A-157]EXB84063.1 hypothetical protein J538_1990 [Acinetobacter sp. 272263]EXC32667.1 hypothetical protein J520_1496 [Acinetobacter sp. 869535]
MPIGGYPPIFSLIRKTITYEVQDEDPVLATAAWSMSYFATQSYK